jgi:hypothetical protein
VDQEVADGLTLRAEVRYDKSTEGDDTCVGDDGLADNDDQVTAGVELLYGF